MLPFIDFLGDILETVSSKNTIFRVFLTKGRHFRMEKIFSDFKGAVGSADLKISKSALLSLNHHNFSNTKPIYTE